MAKKFNKSRKESFNGKPEATGLVAKRGSGIIGDMLNKYANLNFSYYPGSPLLRDALPEGHSNVQTIPTLIKATYVPTVGAYGAESNSAINQAISQLFAKVRSVNAGAVNYSSADLMIFVMSMKSLYSYHAWMSRVLGLINWYSSKDFNIPNEFYQAVNVDIESVRANRVNFAAYIDQFALNANTLSVPNVFPIIKEEAQLCGNIYHLDESNNMGQYLIFEPEGFYRYEENVESGTQFGTLQWKALTNNMTYEDIVAFGDSLIKDVKTSEDHYIMCGDIRKAFDANLVTLDSISSDYKLDPVYNKTVLDALHNANITPLSSIGPITQNGLTEELFQEFIVDTNNTFYRNTLPNLLDSVDWDPDPTRVVELMRWMTTYRVEEGVAKVTANGPEILTHIYIYYRNLNPGDNPDFAVAEFKPYLAFSPRMAGIDALHDIAFTAVMAVMFRTLLGNVLPFQYFKDSFQTDELVYLFGKPRCATIVTDKQIQNVNRVKFYELFGIGEY